MSLATETDAVGKSQVIDVKAEADNRPTDIAEHPRDDKSRPYLCTVCYKQFTRRYSLNCHSRMHSAVKRDDMYLSLIHI